MKGSYSLDSDWEGLDKRYEVGNIFKLGTRYSDSMGCTYAPYQIHLVALKGGEEAANTLYTALESIKFNGADLIRIPLRLTVSERSLKRGGDELKLQRGTEPAIVPLHEVSQRIRAKIRTLEVEIARNAVKVAYNA